MNNQNKQVIGFAFEIVSFTLFGYCLAYKNYNLAALFLAIGFGLAIWTGKQIKEEAREDKEHKLLYCKKCKQERNHLKTGYRKIFESQKYRCLNCGEERT